MDVMYRPLWKSFAPLKCKIFVWLALRYRLWTADRRFRHGLEDRTHACYTCLQEEDTVDHILTQCPYARMVWLGCLNRWDLHVEEPQGHRSLQAWWNSTRDRVQKKDRKRFDTLVILVAWTLWKQRNARTFGNRQKQLISCRL
jgi:hypothetical protein